MPRRIPGPKSHAFPVRASRVAAADGDRYIEAECPNDDRIGAIERRLDAIENVVPDDGGPDWRLEEKILNLQDEVAALARREPTVPRETIGDDQAAFIARRLNALEGRIADLEARPVVSDETLQQLNDALHAKLQTLIEQQVNRALGDLRSRVVTIEKSSNSVTTTASDPDSAKITRLAAMLQSFGEMIRDIETTVSQRQDDIEQRYAEMAANITDNNVKVLKLASKLHGAMQALEHDDEGKAA